MIHQILLTVSVMIAFKANKLLKGSSQKPDVSGHLARTLCVNTDILKQNVSRHKQICRRRHSQIESVSESSFKECWETV